MLFNTKNPPPGHYVYLYIREDGTPYYVGKGTKKRAWTKNKNEVRRPTDPSRIIIFKFNLSESEALDLEIQLINQYGRKDISTGILRNLSDGGKGGAANNNNKHWWTNGTENKLAIDCPGSDWKLGRLPGGGTTGYKFWTNGQIEKKSKTCPGHDWKLGRMIKGLACWNNGEIECRSVESPGPGWIRGKLTKNRFWWNNGTTQKYSKTKPKGNDWKKGRLSSKGKRWWTNGKSQIFSKIKPEGDEWVNGMLPGSGSTTGRKIWNNGIVERFSKGQPEGFVLGRVPKYSKRYN